MKLEETARIRAARPYFTDIQKILDEVREILQSGQLMEGPFVPRFEEAFRAALGTRYAVAVNSCTTALEIVLRFLNIRNRQVIVPAATFVATANAVHFAGGTPVFADVDPDTFCLSPDDLERRISSETAAVIAVHLAGLITPHWDRIRGICEKRNLPLIEDCAHAHGARRGASPAGSLGMAGAFSFYPTKILTTGTGGMITTDNEPLARYARLVRVHGGAGCLSEITEVGNDWFMDEISAVLGFHQLLHLEDFIAHRNQIARLYQAGLQDVPEIRFPEVPVGTRHSYYKIPVRVETSLPIDLLRQRCRERYDLELETLYNPPCHLQPVFRRMYGFQKGDRPVSERIADKQICLPVHAGIGPQEVGIVCDRLRAELRGQSAG